MHRSRHRVMTSLVDPAGPAAASAGEPLGFDLLVHRSLQRVRLSLLVRVTDRRTLERREVRSVDTTNTSATGMGGSGAALTCGCGDVLRSTQVAVERSKRPSVRGVEECPWDRCRADIRRHPARCAPGFDAEAHPERLCTDQRAGPLTRKWHEAGISVPRTGSSRDSRCRSSSMEACADPSVEASAPFGCATTARRSSSS
jgi:hypothetical protein